MTPKQLKKNMDKLGMDARTLANAMGYHESTISKYLSGVHAIPKNFSNHLNLMLAQRKYEE